MHSENFRRRVRLSSLAFGLCALVAVGALATPSSDSGVEKRGSVYCVREGDTLYTFDAVWRNESVLIDADGNGLKTPLASPSPELMARLRGRLLARLGVAGLADIPSEGDREKQSIRSLGYM